MNCIQHTDAVLNVILLLSKVLLRLLNVSHHHLKKIILKQNPLLSVTTTFFLFLFSLSSVFLSFLYKYTCMYIFSAQAAVLACSHHSVVLLNLPLSYWLHVTGNSLSSLKANVSENTRAEWSCSSEQAELFFTDKAEVAKYRIIFWSIKCWFKIQMSALMSKAPKLWTSRRSLTRNI